MEFVKTLSIYLLEALGLPQLLSLLSIVPNECIPSRSHGVAGELFNVADKGFSRMPRMIGSVTISTYGICQ